MGNFISDQVLKFLNPRLAGIGIIDAFDLGENNATATVSLLGEAEPVRVEISGISWSSDEGKFHLHYTEAKASKPWIQGVLNLLAEKNHNTVSFPDKISLMPVKMLFPKNKK